MDDESGELMERMKERKKALIDNSAQKPKVAS